MMLNKKIIKKEITLLHYIMLTTSKLLIGIGIGIWIAQAGFPYTVPIIMAGVLILMPSLYFLFKEEKIIDEKLEKDLEK